MLHIHGSKCSPHFSLLDYGQSYQPDAKRASRESSVREVRGEKMKATNESQLLRHRILQCTMKPSLLTKVNLLSLLIIDIHMH